MMLVHAGNRVDQPGRTPPRFPAEREQYVRERLDALLGLLAPDGIVTSAAAGADLLLIEAATDRSIPLHLVLPFEPRRFRATSVADQGPRWTRSFDAVLDRSLHSLQVLDLDTDEEGMRSGNGALIQRALSLAPGNVLAVAVRPHCGEDPPSVTDDFVRRAEEDRLFVLEVDPLAG
jgi:hypothetical protein